MAHLFEGRGMQEAPPWLAPAGTVHGEQASIGSGGTTADRTTTPATEAHVFYSEAAAAEGWCFPDDLGLWLEMSILCAQVSLRVRGARDCWSGGERTEPGPREAKSHLREQDAPGWRTSLALQTSRAPPSGHGTLLRHSQAITRGSHSVAARDGYHLF